MLPVSGENSLRLSIRSVRQESFPHPADGERDPEPYGARSRRLPGGLDVGHFPQSANLLVIAEPIESFF